MSKSIIIDQFLELNINKEREILSKMKSKFIINIFCSFQDFSNLYLVLQLMSGGDLRYHLYHYSKPFTEDMIKFIIINISLCLQYIHQKGIIHRDIKPENFVFDEKGYLHLTDFGLAIYENENKNIEENIIIEDNDGNFHEDYIQNDLVGTLGYIAPEIILNTNKESFVSDIFSFGIICYELIFRKRPYKGKTRYQIGKEMLNDEISYKSNIKYSNLLFNLIKRLLVINPEERLGTKSGIKEVLENEYLKTFNKKEIQNHSYKSPFIEIIHMLRENNNKVDNIDNIFELFDTYECNKSFEFDEETNLRLSNIEANQDYIFHFREYSYINPEIEEIIENKNYLDFQESETDEKIPKIMEKKLYRSNSDLTEYTYSSSNSYSSKDEIILPEINPKLLRNIYKYKYIKYKLLLNKYNKKNRIIPNKEEKSEDEDKNKEENGNKVKKEEKIKRKKSSTSYSSRTNDSSYSERKKLILNNYFMPNVNNFRNPLYQTPFRSVKNNFILPKINPFLRGFNNAYQNPNYMRNIRNENNRYSRCSSSDTYENLKKNIKYKLKGTNDSNEEKIFINNKNPHKTENNNEYIDIYKEKIKKNDEHKHKKYKLKVKKNGKSKRIEENADKEIKNGKNENEKDKKKNKKIKEIKNGSKEKGKKNDKTKEKKNTNKKQKKTADSDSKEKKIMDNEGENEDEEEESEELTIISEKSEENEKESSEDNKNSEKSKEEGENEDEDEDDGNNEKNEEESPKEEND